MIQMTLEVAGGRLVYMLGLTDVNVQRLTDGHPIAVDASDVPDGADLIIFHATRESCVQFARGVGIEEHRLLDALGEG